MARSSSRQDAWLEEARAGRLEEITQGKPVNTSQSLIEEGTLDYLDPGGRVHNFFLVPWHKLHEWLSLFNRGRDGVPEGLTRGSVLSELERRKGGNRTWAGRARSMVVDTGDGRDWREHEDECGITHFEELLVFQPKDWRRQAREYLIKYGCDINRTSPNPLNPLRRAEVPVTYNTKDGNEKDTKVSVPMSNALLMVLFHPAIPRSHRYQPLNFLLAYDAELVPVVESKRSCSEPLEHFLKLLEVPEDEHHVKQGFMKALSPLDYFFHFREHVAAYDLNFMRKVGKKAGVPRFPLLTELDFCDIVGQRLAKHIIRKTMLHWLTNRQSSDSLIPNRSPLSMIFAGPSGNGKTEIAKILSELLNPPSEEAFHKVDCAKLSDAHELFGMAGAYQGAKQGSALNNFVLKMSRTDQVGVVLMDEIEKADQGVIHALYQVIDKGEWTEKKLKACSEGPQTGIVSCQNLIFVFTTNSADTVIEDRGKDPELFTAPPHQLDVMANKLERIVRSHLEHDYPFTPAFMGRVSAVVPFLPMATQSPAHHHPLLGELTTVVKYLMEREQEKTRYVDAAVEQIINPLVKDKMAQIIVNDCVSSAGVRSAQKLVGDHMGREIMHSCALKKGGLRRECMVEYGVSLDKEIEFHAVEANTAGSRSSDDSDSDEEELFS